MLEQMKKLWKDEEGATAIEYGVMVALITAALVAIVSTLGGQIAAVFTEISGYFDAPPA